MLVPLLWAVPETLIIGELASMLPEEGGYYRWVRRAFGDFWAFQNGWITWMYSLVDMAIYPVLFNAYLAFFFPHLSMLGQWVISLAIIWTAAAINLRGAANVGHVSVFAGLFVLGAFAALTCASIPNIHNNPFVPFIKPGENIWAGLGVGISIALWNYIGWDNASTVQGEVKDASRSYPRALAFTLPLVMLSYLIPLTVSMGASDWSLWKEDGGWPDIARMSAGMFGEPIAILLAVAGMVSSLALFNALLLSYSRIPLAMAGDEMLPKFLARVDSRGTPRNAVLISALFYSVFALLTFTSLVVADVLLYALALFLEFGALIKLRKSEPELKGSFRVPIGRKGIIVLASLPVAMLLFVVGLEIYNGEYGAMSIFAALISVLLGPVMYRVFGNQPSPATN